MLRRLLSRPLVQRLQTVRMEGRRRFNLLKWTIGNDCLRRYRRLRTNRHVFIYSVCGRTGSTFMQRILNSSGAICIYGEQHYTVDKLLEALAYLKKWNNFRPSQYDNLKWSFKRGRHDLWVANAMRPLDLPLLLLGSVVAETLRPLSAVDRFGYKEVRLLGRDTLVSLRELFPNCFFVFLFRNPLDQWPSVKKYMPEDYNNGDLLCFLGEYCRLANCYLEFAGVAPQCTFVEYRAGLAEIERLLTFLEIKSYDASLLSHPVRGAWEFQKEALTAKERDLILHSEAYQCYLSLGQRCAVRFPAASNSEVGPQKYV